MIRLCLTMIVRDEASVIERALRAAVPHIACYVIADTGSSDGTVAIIERVMKECRVPGVVVHTMFENFAQARNEALVAARRSDLDFDYLLLCDADMELVAEPGAFDGPLDADVYALVQRGPDGLVYENARLLRKDAPGRYVGVTRDYLEAGTPPHPVLAGAQILDHGDGAGRPGGLQRDIRLLSEGLRDDPKNARYQFYLAQCHASAGEFARAFRAYEKRVELGGWEEEVWYSLLQLGLLAEDMGRDHGTVVGNYLRAHQARPTRAESLFHLARYHRLRGDWALAWLFARSAVEIPRPGDVLFVDESVYSWRAQDEYAVACYWTGRHAESLRVCDTLLAGDALPAEHRSRVEANRGFNLDKIRR